MPLGCRTENVKLFLSRVWPLSLTRSMVEAVFSDLILEDEEFLSIMVARGQLRCCVQRGGGCESPEQFRTKAAPRPCGAYEPLPAPRPRAG